MKPSEKIAVSVSLSQMLGSILIAFSVLFCFQDGYAQEPADTSGYQIKSRDSTFIKSNKDSLSFEIQKRRMDASGIFYGKVKSATHRNFFSRQLYPLLFKKSPSNYFPEKVTENETLPFLEEKGKIIKSIRIKKIAVFGSNVFDTTAVSDYWIDKTMNDIHFPTLDRVIKSYIQIREGDRVNPILISDNERIIRQSAFFEDARFILDSIPGTDSVNVVLIVRDVFPIGFDVKVKSGNRSSFRLFNRNILGFGHQLEQSFELDTRNSKFLYLSEGAYKIRNINRSFTDAVLMWQNKPGVKRTGLGFIKPFISPETRFGGGANIQVVSTWLIPGITDPATKIEYSVYDFWSGYSTIINRFKSPSADRSIFAITGRYYNINYSKTPALVVQTENPAVTLNRYIAAISLIKSGYFRNNMIYSFGRTEDIPTGHFAQLVGGYETSILLSRYYSGFKLMSGKQFNKGGFIYSWLEGGGYWSKKSLSDGIVGIGAEYISILYKAGSYRMRSFGSFSYKTGFNRVSSGVLQLNNNDYSETFSSFRVADHQRLRARAETVVFTPYYLLGFRFAAYSFVEAAMVAPSGEYIFSRNLYPAIGLGLRIRNENLAFSTFQLSFTWFGRSDAKGRNILFEFTDIPQVDLNRFSINAPDFADYQ